MSEVRGLVSCRSRVQALRLLRFPLTEVARSSPSRWLPCGCSPNLPGGTVPALSPSVFNNSRHLFGASPFSKERVRAPQGCPPRSEELGAPPETPDAEAFMYLSGEGCCPPPTMESLSSSVSEASFGGTCLPVVLGQVDPSHRSNPLHSAAKLCSFCESVRAKHGCPRSAADPHLAVLPL